MAGGRFLPQATSMVGGLIVWAAHFAFVYGFSALVCARGLAGAGGIGAARIVIVVATAIAIVLVAADAFFAWSRRTPAPARRRQDDFLRTVRATIASLSLVAIVWNTLPALLTPLCR